MKPDGCNGARTVVVDHLVANNITCVTAAGFAIQTTPGMLPVSALITGNGGTGALDINVDGVALVNYNAAAGRSFAPIGIPTEWASSVFGQPQWTPSGVSKNDPYTSAKARVTAVQRKLFYTGTLVGNAGYVAVTPSAYSLSGVNALVSNSTGVPAPNTINISLLNNAAVTVAQANLNSQFRAMDVEFTNSPLFTKDTVTGRVERGIDIVSKQCGSIHELVDLPDSGFWVIANQSVNPPTGGAVYVHYLQDLTGAGTPIGCWMYDPTWEGELIQVTGIQAGATFRLETTICVEYEVQSASPFAVVAQKAPPANMPLVKAAQDAVNMMPVATFGDQQRTMRNRDPR